MEKMYNHEKMNKKDKERRSSDEEIKTLLEIREEITCRMSGKRKMMTCNSKRSREEAVRLKEIKEITSKDTSKSEGK